MFNSGSLGALSVPPATGAPRSIRARASTRYGASASEKSMKRGPPLHKWIAGSTVTPTLSCSNASRCSASRYGGRILHGPLARSICKVFAHDQYAVAAKR
jgi:hypothetical protein